MPLTQTQRKSLTLTLQRALDISPIPDLELESLTQSMQSERDSSRAFFDENPQSTAVAGELLSAMLDNVLGALSRSDPALKVALACDEEDEIRAVLAGLVMYAYYLGRTEEGI